MGKKKYEDIIQIIKDSDPKKDWVQPKDSHKEELEIRFHKEDVNLRFEINRHDGTHVVNSDFKENWANFHSDPKASSYYVGLYYASTLVETFFLVSVDGGRASLPLPKTANNFTFNDLDYKVAQIHDSFDTLTDYIGRTNRYLAKINKDV
jgi:hypothetical protein